MATKIDWETKFKKEFVKEGTIARASKPIIDFIRKEIAEAENRGKTRAIQEIKTELLSMLTNQSQVNQ